MFTRRANLVLACAILVIFRAMAGPAGAAVLYWDTSGATGNTWTSSKWGASASGPFTSGWTSGASATFGAASTLAFASSTVANVTVNANTTVTAGGTFSNGGTVSTFTVGSGVTLTWEGQAMATAAGTGFIKAGAGTWDLSAETGAYPGGFTLNAGTVMVTKNNSFGNGAMTINGGTIQSTNSSTFAASSLAIGGSYTLAGNGVDVWNMPVNLGSATPGITNSTTGGSTIRLLGGVISGSAGTGLTFAGSGAGTINVTNAGNTFTGPISILGAEVQFQNDGSFGAVPASATPGAIVIDGGRLTSADGTQSGVTYTLNSKRGIELGATPGTSISVKAGSGTLTYNGIITDEPGSAGTLVKQGAGTLVLGGASTYSGGTSNNNGTIQLAAANALPTGTILNLGQAGSANVGTLDLGGNSQQVAGLVSIAGINLATVKNEVTNSSATVATITLGGGGIYAYGDGSTNNSGVIAGPLNVVMNGSGSQTLGDTNNSFSGTLTVQQGTLAVPVVNNASANGPLGNSANAVTLGAGGGTGTLEYTGNTAASTKKFTLAGSGTGAIQIDTAGQTLTLTGVVGGSGGALQKTGAGTLVLNATETYSGTTTVGTGTLSVGAGGSVASTPALTVASGATLDVSAGGLTLTGSGPQQTLGGGSPSGTASVNAPAKTVTLNTGALLSFQAAGGVAGTVGKISVTGGAANLTLNNNAVTVNVTGPALAAGTYRLMDCPGTLTGSAGATPTIAGTALSGGYTAAVSTTAGSGGHFDLVVKATPVFSGLLAGPAITYGAGSVTLAGTVSSPAGVTTVYPASGDTVSATINGHTVNGTVTNSTGAFSITYNDASLATDGAGGSPYTITYAYGGNGAQFLDAATNNTATALTVNQAGVTVTVASSGSPSGYKGSVYFTATVPAGATGNVIFATNGTALSTNAVSGGMATSAATTLLSRGTNVITAVYGGDADFLPGTNTFDQTVTNHPPVAGVMTVTRTAGVAVEIALSDLATNWSDADGDAVSLTAISLTTTNGVALFPIELTTNGNGSYVITNLAYLGYVNGAAVADRFSYSISDGQGGTNMGVVNIVIQSSVTGTNSITGITGTNPKMLTAYGVPGFSYIAERSTNLTSWVDVSTNTAGADGAINVTDAFGDLGGNAPSSAYYRLKWAGN